MTKLISAGCVCVDVFEQEGELRAGGEALNFCGNACTLSGVETALAGVTGDDAYADFIRERLRTLPVDTSHLHMVHGATANHRIRHTADGDRWFAEGAWNGGVQDAFRLDGGDLAFLQTADAVHTMYDSPLFGQVLEARRQGGFLLAVDFNDHGGYAAWEEYLRDIDLFFISDAAGDWCENALREWSRRFGGVFTVTHGAAGSVSFCGGREYRCAAVPVEKVIDTTGAGDSYIAGFTAEYARSHDIVKAMEQGSALAAANIVRLGGF